MTMKFVPLLFYVFISTFTPGPSNIASASSAVMHGYKYSLAFQGGLAVGVFFIMLLSGWVSTALLGIFPSLEPVLRYVGAAYILYLAYGVLKASYTFVDSEAKPLGFVHGLMLQVLNPKLIVYAFTLFSTFLAPITGRLQLLVLAAVFLAVVSFASTSLWALFGATIKTYLRQPRLKTLVNILFALALIYTAIALI